MRLFFPRKVRSIHRISRPQSRPPVCSGVPCVAFCRSGAVSFLPWMRVEHAMTPTPLPSHVQAEDSTSSVPYRTTCFFRSSNASDPPPPPCVAAYSPAGGATFGPASPRSPFALHHVPFGSLLAALSRATRPGVCHYYLDIRVPAQDDRIAPSSVSTPPRCSRRWSCSSHYCMICKSPDLARNCPPSAAPPP